MPNLSGVVSALQVATVLTVYGIETVENTLAAIEEIIDSCNSTYRLRY